MKRALAFLAAPAFLGAILLAPMPSAFAQDATACPDFASVDSDQSGDVSFDELSAAVPGITQDAFNAADADQSGSLSQDEYATLDCSGGMSGSDSSGGNSSQ